MESERKHSEERSKGEMVRMRQSKREREIVMVRERGREEGRIR